MQDEFHTHNDGPPASFVAPDAFKGNHIKVGAYPEPRKEQTEKVLKENMDFVPKPNDGEKSSNHLKSLESAGESLPPYQLLSNKRLLNKPPSIWSEIPTHALVLDTAGLGDSVA